MLLKALTTLRFCSSRVKPNKKPQVPFNNWQIVRGDQVQIRAGNDRGKVGKVMKVYRKSNAVVVEGINLKFTRFRTENESSVLQQKPFKIHVSNVGLYDPVAKRAVRIKYGYHPETFEKLRISRKTGVIIPKPKIDLKRQTKGKNKKKGVKDTAANIAHQVTYEGEDFAKIKKQFEAFIAEKERREKNLVFAF